PGRFGRSFGTDPSGRVETGLGAARRQYGHRQPLLHTRWRLPLVPGGGGRSGRPVGGARSVATPSDARRQTTPGRGDRRHTGPGGYRERMAQSLAGPAARPGLRCVGGRRGRCGSGRPDPAVHVVAGTWCPQETPTRQTRKPRDGWTYAAAPGRTVDG